jgi:[protein-PII] uridylyltransferase
MPASQPARGEAISSANRNMPPAITSQPATAAPDLSRLAEWRARLSSIRQQARSSYDSGATGLQVSSLISQKTDDLILQFHREALEQRPAGERAVIAQDSALIAIGGSGRGEMAPYSDVDLLLLHRPGARDTIEPWISQLVRNLWDAGVSLGHSTRTAGNALSMAANEPEFFTAVLEARLLTGDQRLFVSLQHRLRRMVMRRQSSMFAACVAAREQERAQFGSTMRHLEPEIKRSPGGLRDIHLIRWTGFVRFGTSDIDLLRRQDALTRDDAQTLLAALEFLTRIRMDLHFSAEKAEEVLTRAEQLRLTEMLGFRDTEGQRAVERFMQTYFRHTAAIADISARFVARHEPHTRVKRLWNSLFARRCDEIFRVARHELDVLPRHRDAVARRIDDALRVFELAARHGVTLSPQLVETIQRAVPGYSSDLSETACRSFLSILNCRGRVGSILREMYSTGVLEKVLPPFAHMRCLLQFNQYHSYTVDEHTLRVIEAAEAWEFKSGPFRDAYREVRHRDILRLAMLLHDAGKGFPEDHSDVGRRIAADMAARLRLSPHLSDLLQFLVHKHLIMAHVALRRNIDDINEVLKLAREVGSPEQLRMLYVLTAADIQGVGPNAWTDWKGEFLTQLYDRAMVALSGEDPHARDAARRQRLQSRVRDCLRSSPAAQSAWTDDILDRHFATLPLHYLLATSAEQIARDLTNMSRLPAESVIVESQFDTTTNTVEYRVLTLDQIGSGCFSKMAGALAAKRMQILSANICTTTEGVVVDTFRVVDTDHAGAIPAFRQDDVTSAIRAVLLGKDTVEDLFRRSTQFNDSTAVMTGHREPTRVVIDNDSSDQFTVIDVFAHDRPGLLHTIAACLLNLELSVSLAKIATHLDQVLDVFYVTDRAGGKVLDESRLEAIQRVLVERIEDFERNGFAT